MVMINTDGHTYSMDGYLKSNLEFLMKTLRKDWDAFIIGTGREGTGKSTLIGQCAKFVDPTYNLSRCCFTAEQFLKAVENAKKYQAVVFDEAYGYLNTRQVMSKFNRVLVKVMTEMRSKNLFVFIVLPNFFELDKYAAIHRSTALLHVHKRGRFSCFDFNRKKILYLKGKKFYTYSGATANFVGSFSKYFVLDAEAYEQKKRSSVLPTKQVMEDVKSNKHMDQRDKCIKYLFDNDKLPKTTIAKIVGISPSSVADALKKLEPKAQTPLLVSEQPKSLENEPKLAPIPQL